MTSHNAITDATETVVTVLRDGVADREDTDLDAEQVVVASPADLSPDADVRLSVFPYKITRESKGRPGQIQTGQDTFREPPLVLTINYLLTAHPVSGTDGATTLQKQQSALGVGMQVLHDNATPENLIGSLQDSASFRIELHSDSNSGIERVWDTFVDTPIQPAVIYEAGPVTIESRREREVTRVSERDVDIDRTE